MTNFSHRIQQKLKLIIAFLGVIWLVFIADRLLPLEQLGLVPRDMGGLVGIVTMPFLHKDWSHILSNTAPLAVLLALLSGSRADSSKVVVMTSILGGILLWLFGRNSLHIGASLLVFGLAAFLIVSGFLEQRTLHLLISVVVLVFYGGSLLGGIMPWQKGVSWEGHLLGGVAGAVIAWFTVKRQ